MGTVDVLLSPPDLPLQAPPHVRPLEVSTETPLRRQDGSVDSHRELRRKNMAQFPGCVGNAVHLNIPLQNGAELWGAEGLKTRQRGKQRISV